MKSFALLPFLAVSALTAFFHAPVHAAPRVTLNVEAPDGELTPRSAFELRFEEAMVADEAVASPPKRSRS